MINNITTKNLITLLSKTNDEMLYKTISKELQNRNINTIYSHTTWLDNKDIKIDTRFVSDRMCYETIVIDTNNFKELDCAFASTIGSAEKNHEKLYKKHLTNNSNYAIITKNKTREQKTKLWQTQNTF